MEEWCAYIDENDNRDGSVWAGFWREKVHWDEVAGKW